MTTPLSPEEMEEQRLWEMFHDKMIECGICHQKYTFVSIRQHMAEHKLGDTVKFDLP